MLNGQQALFETMVVVFDIVLLALEALDLLSLSFARGLSRGAVA